MQATRPTFHALTLAAVIPETAHAVRLRFTVPTELRATFVFQAGQFVTLRATVNGLDIRRSYSICTTPQSYAELGSFEVGVKHVVGGVFSAWAQQLSAGQALQVMPPDGRFTLSKTAKNVLAIAAGSGITPLLAMMGERLASDPQVHFTLLYGNRSVASTLFLESLQALKNRYSARLSLHHVLSRQLSDIALHNGRLDAAKLNAFLSGALKPLQFDTALVCGPNELIDLCEGMLPSYKVGKVLSERFGTPHAAPQGVVLGGDGTPEYEPLAELTIVYSGQQHAVTWNTANPLLLDAGLAAGLDLPYACKGGVCCTCRAKVLEGSVVMDKNHTLELDELAAGFVLTCQCRPTSERVVVSFDER